MSRDEERLAELEERAESMRRRMAELDEEAERLRRERDRYNESTRELRAAALKHREERDLANQRVAEIKRRMDALRRDLSEWRMRFAEVDTRLEEERRRLPHRRRLEERLRNIEWEMMTTPTSEMIEREGAMAEEARALRRSLDAHVELDAFEDERLRVLADIKTAELALRGSREDIAKLNEASEAEHREMNRLFARADEERERADEAHARFLEHLSSVRVVDDELMEVIEEARRLRGRLGEKERRAAAEREREAEERRAKLMTEARQKLDAGERLSLEELRLLYGEGKDEE